MDSMIIADVIQVLEESVETKDRKDTDKFIKIEPIEEEETKSDRNGIRDHWSHQIEFVLTMIGYSVGVSNIWRFPYLCMRNGGGAFLIPYFFFLFIAGIPLFFMELYMGQFSSLSPIKVWKICPLMTGLGCGMIIVSLIFSFYYQMLLVWTIYFFGVSFTSSVLPWSTCNNTWNTKYCVDDTKYVTLLNSSLPKIGINATMVTTPAQEFWENNVLEMSDGIDNIGTIRWELALCLIVSWIIVFLCLIKGVKSSGKVVYVTATLPYLLLTILLVRGLTLPGSMEGIKFYLYPDWSRLSIPSLWAEACLQIFYSLGPAWGGIHTCASYNKFNHNFLRDALIIPIVNCGTSFFGGFVVFSVIGFLAYDTGLPVDEVIKSGPGLAFIAYPSALARMPLPQFWSAFFFFMLFAVGIDSQFMQFEAFLTGVMDLFPKFLKYRPLFTGVVSILLCIGGLIFTTNGGIYYFQIIDWYFAMLGIIIIAILETVAVSWIYGVGQVARDIELMLGRKIHRCLFLTLKSTWCFLTPVSLLGCMFYVVTTVSPPTNGNYIFPDWSISFGWFLASISLIPIPTYMVYIVSKYTIRRKDFIKGLLNATLPSLGWGPAKYETRAQYKYQGNLAKFYDRLYD